MNAQEVLNRVTKHLFDQGIASVGSVEDQGEICVYRSPNGLTCAVGCLIPDDAYTQNMENKNVFDLVYSFDKKLPEHIRQNQVLLKNLQEVHDERMPRYKVCEGRSDVWDLSLYDQEMRNVSRRIQEIALEAGLEDPAEFIPEQYRV